MWQFFRINIWQKLLSKIHNLQKSIRRLSVIIISMWFCVRWETPGYLIHTYMHIYTWMMRLLILLLLLLLLQQEAGNEWKFLIYVFVSCFSFYFNYKLIYWLATGAPPPYQYPSCNITHFVKFIVFSILLVELSHNHTPLIHIYTQTHIYIYIRININSKHNYLNLVYHYSFIFFSKIKSKIFYYLLHIWNIF